MKSILVLGATGLVGGAIARALARRGDTVIAAGRNAQALDALAKASPSIHPLRGDVSSDASAKAMGEAARQVTGSLDAVVASLNPPRSSMRLTEEPIDGVLEFLRGGLLSHLAAARTLIPMIAEGGSYVAIGGASSDFVWPGHGHISTSQAAQRMLFKVIAQELSAAPVKVREYVIAAMVHDGSGAEGVSADVVAGDFVRALDERDGPAVVRFPAKR